MAAPTRRRATGEPGGSWEIDVSASCVLYVRVSTVDQDLAGQERELRAEAVRRGWTVHDVLRDKATATGRIQRASYEQLLKDAADAGRPWHHLLCWALDRFSREATFTKATQTILDLEKLGVQFHSLKEPMLDTPDDGKPNLGRDVLLALLPVIASFESTRRAERVRVAMSEIRAGRRATRSGRPVGRPRRVTPELVERAETLRRRGLPWREVAQRVGLPAGTCRSMVYKAKRAAQGA
jgi:DNA invertase Pin-like site-specific DNA recombinase